MSFSSDRPLLSNQLPISIDFPEDPTSLVSALTLAYKRIADAVNSKEGALYQLQESASFNQFFPTNLSSNSNNSLNLRPVYRMVYDLVELNGGPIPIGTTVINVPAGQLIDGIVDPTSLKGTGTISGPIYVSLHSANSDATFDNTTPAAQTITVENNYPSAMDQAYLTFEYTKT